jgi:hypothetical protein
MSSFRHIRNRVLSGGRCSLKHIGRLTHQRAEIFIEASHTPFDPLALNSHGLANVPAMSQFFKRLDGILRRFLPTPYPTCRRSLECVDDAYIEPQDYLDRPSEDLGTVVARRGRRY